MTPRGLARQLAIALGAVLVLPQAARAQPASRAPDPLAAYFTALEATHLVDVESGNLESLKAELHVGEGMLKTGSYVNAAVALYAIVKSPRYDAFKDFVEFQNAEYDLAVALAKAGSYGAALDAIEPILARGPAATYWGPAHRRAVDIALETRDHAGVLARLEAIKTDAVPVSAAGERAYLRGRAAYDSGQLAAAEGELVTISKQSRMYSSALYLRGVIRARRGEYKESAAALCEVAGTPDSDHLTFVVDDRYFTVKDLARLGLGRLAHEQGEYDDAYYHYFQIPDDSVYLPDALFEAAWSMYQKRELATARDLTRELLAAFPSAPTWPEASLLAGYVDLADCKFDDSQKWYDALATKLQPIVDTIDRARTDRSLRDELFAQAITRYRETKDGGKDGDALGRDKAAGGTPTQQVLALLRLDPAFIRLNDAVTGIDELARSAPATVRQWQTLGVQVSQRHVAAVTAVPTMEQEQLDDANALVEDLRRLETEVAAGRDELARGRREGTLPPDVAAAEEARLAALAAKVATTRHHALAQADVAAAAATADATPGVRPLITADVAEARRLDKAAHALAEQLRARGDVLAQAAIEKLYVDTRRVLDKARLGKIDAVIGQKRKLDIEVQDLAAGRFPAELVGRMWNASLIGDDEEYWPWQGEYWKDEYEGFR